MFDLRTHNGHQSGKPKSIKRPGLQVALQDEYLGYKIEIVQRPASPISSREMYSVQVDGGDAMRRRYLTGFLTTRSARAAAITEIEKLEAQYGDVESPIAHILSSLKRQRRLRKQQGSDDSQAA